MWTYGREGRYRSGRGGGGEEEVEMVDGEKVKGEVQEVEEVEGELVEEMETEMRRRIKRSPNERESEGKGREEPEVKNACLRL